MKRKTLAKLFAMSLTLVLAVVMLTVPASAEGLVTEITAAGGSLDSGTYTLTADVSLGAGASIVIPEGETVTIDLGNFALTGSTAQVPVIRNNGTLTIKNGSVHRTAGDWYTVINYGTIVLDNITMDSGSVTPSASAMENMGTMTIESGTYRTKGCNIVKNEPSSKKLTINGGTFEHQYAGSGAGIIMNYTELEINGGEFTLTTYRNTFVWFDDAEAVQKPKVSINGGIFTPMSINYTFYSNVRMPDILFITGGTFPLNYNDYIQDGYTAVVTADGDGFINTVYSDDEIAQMIADGEIAGRIRKTDDSFDNYYLHMSKVLMQLSNRLNANYEIYLYKTPADALTVKFLGGYTYHLYLAEGVNADALTISPDDEACEIIAVPVATLPAGIASGTKYTAEPSSDTAVFEVITADGAHVAYANKFDQAALFARNNPYIVKFLKNIGEGTDTEVKYLSVNSGALTVDLNGKTYKNTPTSTGYLGAFVLSGGATLTVTDSVGGGQVIGGGDTAYAFQFKGTPGSTLEFKGGTFCGNILSSSSDDIPNSIRISGGSFVPPAGESSVGVVMSNKWDMFYIYLSPDATLPSLTYSVPAGSEAIVSTVPTADLPVGFVSGLYITAPITENSASAKIVAANGSLVGYYAHPYDATTHAKAGETIVLLRDVGYGTPYKISSSNYYIAPSSGVNCILDLNGHSITNTGTTSTAKAGTIRLFTTGCGFTIIDSVGGGSVNTVTANNNVIYLANDSNSLTIAGGTFNGNLNYVKGTLVITGGTFAFDPTPYVPTTGYAVIKNADGTMWSVYAYSGTLVIEKDPLVLEKGKTVQAEGFSLTYPAGSGTDTILWTSSNPTVASVTQDGQITALSTGTTTVTVKVGDLASATYKVVVYEINEPVEHPDNDTVGGVTESGSTGGSGSLPTEDPMETLHDEIIDVATEIIVNGSDELVAEGVVDATTAANIQTAMEAGKVIETTIVIEYHAPQEMKPADVAVAQELLAAVGATMDTDDHVYLDLRIELHTEDGFLGYINELETEIPFTVEIPEELRKPGRLFLVARVHEGVAEILPATVSDDGTTATFYSDAFSLYLLTYYDAFVITFDANGGIVDVPSISTDLNGYLSTPPVATRNGWTFKGWYTEKVGGTKVDFTAPFNATTTVYAQWDWAPIIPSVTYTLTLESNGGTRFSTLTVTPGLYVDLSMFTPVREGYTFAGWFTDPALTLPITSTVMTKSLTVYAGWTAVDIVEPPVISLYPDVKLTDWYYDEIAYVHTMGWMQHTGEGLFEPEANTSRGMIVTIIWRIAGMPNAVYTGAMLDVPADKYYADAMEWAAAYGIVNGDGAGNFMPEQPVSREEMAAMLYRYAQYKRYDLSGVGETELSLFPDRSEISDYALTSMKWVVKNGIISGRDTGVLDPTGLATRGEVAAIFYRFAMKFIVR